ncbi:MAG TPA: twin-arginine translocase TatA/TatE family subunit [Acidimicrobiales bacterium]|nr:twin-arginine translocase TatA/TatE family subunit [Acidimicrobiales bacterium]
MHPSLLANLLGPDGLIILVVVIVVLLFGGNKLPKLARGLGAASHEFRKGIEEGDAETKKGTTDRVDRADEANRTDRADRADRAGRADRADSAKAPESEEHDSE